MDNITDEQFQHLLSSFDMCPPEFESFGPFMDPNLFPEEFAQITDLPPLDYDSHSVQSIATSVPEMERDEALALARWTQTQLDQQIAKQREMQLEYVCCPIRSSHTLISLSLDAMRATFDKVRKYHVETLNPWVESVTAALHKLGCMQEETPASATDGEFDINIPNQL
ncbi:hypothetical protein N7451_010930 [Penicillium sp. IBT 35674x]|nr:hypothetical protein N7451_010930 [Penicillium sp. IBT 35674x]